MKENGTRETILIVDDTTANIDVLNGLLKNDYKIKFATNGKMALKLADKFKPDLILLDIMMPEMNGYDVCKKLKENPVTKNIPVMFVTAKDQDFDEVLGFEVGGVDYVVKPISPVVVKARVKTHLFLANQKAELAKQVKEQTEEINRTRLQIIKKLGLAAEYKDNETGMHIIRMSRYSQLIAKNYGIPDEDAELLLNAAPMHDIGKIGIPDNILKKKGRLDPDERVIMETHAEIGGKILGGEETVLLDTAAMIAREHHEKWNGKGYPVGLKGEEISIFARITAVADVFDALTSKRPYKEAWEVERAVKLIEEEAGEHFDPGVVKVFKESLDEILKIKAEYSE